MRMSGAWGGGRSEKSVLKQTPQWAWSLILSRDPESMTRAEIKSWLPQRLSHPGATSSVLYRGWAFDCGPRPPRPPPPPPPPLCPSLFFFSFFFFVSGSPLALAPFLQNAVTPPLNCFSPLSESHWHVGGWSLSGFDPVPLIYLYTVPFVYPFTNTTHFWLL